MGGTVSSFAFACVVSPLFGLQAVRVIYVALLN